MLEFQQISYAASRRVSARQTCYLIPDTWDDYGFKTTYKLVYFDSSGTRNDIGPVKIMHAGLQSGLPEVPRAFKALDMTFCSLGQTQAYYENLMHLEERERITILESLQDAAWNPALYRAFAGQHAFDASLLRSVSPSFIEKYRDVLHGRVRETPFHFSYDLPHGTATLEFQITPKSHPPSNIHAIIGKNGVGKTRLLNSISALLQDGPHSENEEKLGRLTFHDVASSAPFSRNSGFANLVAVSFSAFDDFTPPLAAGTPSGILYSYLGLRLPSDRKRTRASKSVTSLRNEFVQSTLACLRSSRKHPWLHSMGVLESDPIFAEMHPARLAAISLDDAETQAGAMFIHASAGHKVVLLTITRLVELVGERTLVLIDEPEAHLHPPLAASFVRALSDLLKFRNGAAILATHSPVIVQELPSDCVWMLFRDGATVTAERPQVETFAGNIGVLTREAFRFEVTNSGYHALIAAAVREAISIDEVMGEFGEHLGAEGRAIARALWRNRRHQ